MHFLIKRHEIDLQPKIAKYCQWDGYPSGRGVELLEVLQKYKDNFAEMKEKVSKVVALTDELGRIVHPRYRISPSIRM